MVAITRYNRSTGGLPLPITALSTAMTRKIAWYKTSTSMAAFGAIYGQVGDASSMVITFETGKELSVKPGQIITFFANRQLAEFTSVDVAGEKLTALYNANTLSFESLACSEGVIKKDAISDDPLATPTFNYQYYLTDHLGSTRMVLAGADGASIDARIYDPYGKLRDVQPGTEKIRERFTGKELDEEGATASGAPGIQLSYFGKRFYDADVGRWVSVDPAKQFWDLYNYCGNNPIITNDPDGGAVPAIVIYAYMMACSRDASLDMRWISQDIATKDYAGLVGDVAGVFAPGTGYGRVTSRGWELAQAIGKSTKGEYVSSKAYKLLVEKGAEIHHIFTNKSKKSGISAAFTRYLAGAGMTLKDAENLVPILGHGKKGAHGKSFWQPILLKLDAATSGLKRGTLEYNEAVLQVLQSAGKTAVEKYTR